MRLEGNEGRPCDGGGYRTKAACREVDGKAGNYDGGACEGEKAGDEF